MATKVPYCRGVEAAAGDGGEPECGSEKTAESRHRSCF
jgi:hypothetical protein